MLLIFNFLFKENHDLQKQKVQLSLAFKQVYYSVLTKVTKDLNSEKKFFLIFILGYVMSFTIVMI